MSPAQGRCNSGPTAVIKSITKIDHKLAANGTLLNMKFNASLLRSPEKRKKFIAMLKTYMDLGGYHVQFNFIDTELLREAQRHPEKYPDLLVRVAAYVAQFTALPKELQDDIIARSELDIA
jgi:formate C-acetyltransferase